MSCKLFPLYSIAVLALLTGCSSVEKFSGGSPQLVAAPDKVSAQLADAADRASSALESLAAIEQAKTPVTSAAPIDNAPTELRRAVTVNWVGPIEPITKTLSDRAGYGFVVMGPNPGVPVVVSIDAENEQIINILRDLGLQLGMRGDIKVDARNKMVEINYVPNAGVDG